MSESESVSVSRTDLIALLNLQDSPRAVPTIKELQAIDRLRAALGFVWNEVTGRWDATRIDGDES